MSDAQFIKEVLRTICDEEGNFLMPIQQFRDVVNDFLITEVKKQESLCPLI